MISWRRDHASREFLHRVALLTALVASATVIISVAGDLALSRALRDVAAPGLAVGIGSALYTYLRTRQKDKRKAIE